MDDSLAILRNLSRVLPHVVVGIVALATVSCRDVPTFAAPHPDEESRSAVQLTYSAGDELNPVWTRDSDTLLYTATKFFDSPDLPSVMLRLSKSRGAAEVIAPGQFLVLPVPSPNDDRVAYVELGFPLPPAVCQTSPNPQCKSNEPLLAQGTVHVRAKADILRPAYLDIGTDIKFEGVDANRALVQPPYVQRVFPFQLAYRERNELFFRPSWSPDGSRLIFSNGLYLFTWDLTTSPATRIPNTLDALSPAWSPDGSLIAFTRVVRTDSIPVVCLCKYTPDQKNIDLHDRWTYTVSEPMIATMKPDGTGLRELTVGTSPAWSPDGRTLYFSHADQIFRISRDGGVPSAIANTNGARSPAVSPDGKWLAFTRATVTVGGSTGDQNIWVLRLDVP